MKQMRWYFGTGTLLLCLSGCAHAPLTSEIQQQLPPAQVQHGQPDGQIDGMLSSAKAQYEQHRLEAAERTLEAVLDLDPANQKGLYYLGLAARQTWLEAHPGQHRTARQPEQLPVPTPRRNL